MLRLARLVASWLGTVLLLVGAVAGIINHEVLDADRFAAHVDEVRTDPDVARQVGALVTERILEQEPDLVTLRPLIEATATGVVASRALGPVVRGGVAPLYDALVLGGDDPVVLRLADVGAVVVGALTVLAPQVAVSLPADLDVRLSDIGAGRLGPDVVRPVHLVRQLSWAAPVLGLTLLAVPAVLGSGPRRLRRGMAAVGRGVLGAGGLLAALLVLAGAVIRRAEPDTLANAVRLAVWQELAGPAWVTAAGCAAAGLVLALAGGPPSARSRTLLWAGVCAAVGLALVVDPVRVATALLWLLGAGLLVLGLATVLLTVTRTPAARTWLAVAAAVVLVGVGLGSRPADRDLSPAAAADGEACNGHVELCDRRYDDVAFPATHNAMSAASDSGWFFPEQPDGIIDQLDAGIRVLLIDSWYGRRSNRPGIVTTVGEARERAVDELTEAVGAAAVSSALRLARAVGLTPRGSRQPYLCHGLCELGSTSWSASLLSLRAWLDAHPREVVTLVVQDEVSPDDTARLVEEAGLLPDVYTHDPWSTWPTLGQMVESGKRLVILMENRGGGAEHPWLLQGFDWIQDTPFLFRSSAALERADSCRPNRGRPDAPLLLVNHWVTDKRSEVTNAVTVNRRDVLGRRVARCREERGMLPNFVAVDFYDRGDLFAVVDDLNGLG